jgi:hypothetical protein
LWNEAVGQEIGDRFGSEKCRRNLEGDEKGMCKE